MPAALALLALGSPAGAQAADSDPPAIEDIEDTTDIRVTPPTNTWLGTRGLSQTYSAEALGQGRLVLGVHGPWYRQERSFAGVPNQDADIFAGRASAAVGFNRFVDGFASLSFYGSNNYTTDDGSGLGTFGGGLQGTLPFTAAAPIRMGALVGVFNGFSGNPVDSNAFHGYNYFETRTGLDVHGHLLQSIVIGPEAAGIKLHLNEGVVTSLEDGVDPLLLLGAGLQFNLLNLPVAALGVEIHSRTQLEDVALTEDPLWITPSVQFRTGYNLNFQVGGDISMSQDADVGSPAPRALEPWRLHGGLAFTFDTQEEARRQEKNEAIRRAQELRRLEQRNAELAAQVRADSIRAAEAGSRTTDITALSEKARQDSLASVERARRDSLALADTRRRLELERSRSGDMESQLLTTGLLVMDAVYFETGKAVVSINSMPYLNMLAKMLTKYPKLRIEVAGHTDNVGSDAYNMNLSQARAATVMSHLVGQAPELSGRLTARGYGESMPKADNMTADGRMRNRRTELEVLNKEALEEYNQPPTQQSRAPSEQGVGGTGEGGTADPEGKAPADTMDPGPAEQNVPPVPQPR